MLINPVGKPEWREGQEAVAQQVVDALEEHKRPVGLRAPTGIGKSMIGVSLGEHLGGKTIFLTGTHQLQQQYLGDFPHLVDFRGKENYPCPLIDNGESAIRACTETAKTPACPHRSYGRCPYYNKLREVMNSKGVVTNYANFLALGYRKWTANNLILDEAHNLSEVLGDYGKLELNNGYLRELGFTTFSSSDAPTMTPEDWDQYVNQLVEEVGAVVDEYEAGNLRELADEQAKHYQRVSNLLRKLENAPIHSDQLEFWVDPIGKPVGNTYTPTWSAVRLQPLFPEQLAPHLLFSRGERVILMSATLPEYDELYHMVEVPSTFNPAKSPVLIKSQPRVVAKDWSQKSAVVRQLVEAVDQGVEHFWTTRQMRSLIVLASHAQVKAFMEISRLSGQMIGIDVGGLDKKELLENYLTRDDVISLVVGSEMCTGLDLPGDLASVTFLLKGPWRIPANVKQGERPNWLYRRNEVDPDYIPMQAATWFAQMIGRATRSEDDVNPVFVFDSSWWNAHYGGMRMGKWLPQEVKDRIEAGKKVVV